MNNAYIWIVAGLAVLILILLMLLATFFLLKNGRGRKRRRKGGSKQVKRKAESSGIHKSENQAANIKKEDAKVPRETLAGGGSLPLRGLSDEGIEKYEKMTDEYSRSKLGTELKRVGLKKYYSKRHGSHCVDFSYRIISGMSPSQFRTHLNDVDTALSIVSGVDTITFAVDNNTGVFRTTFYLGK